MQREFLASSLWLPQDVAAEFCDWAGEAEKASSVVPWVDDRLRLGAEWSRGLLLLLPESQVAGRLDNADSN